MSYCTNCGVELDEGIICCPLCGFNIGAKDQSRDKKEEYFPSDIIVLHKKETRRHIWELSGVIAFSAIAVCTIVNFVIFRKLSWSLFADTAIVAVWISLTLILLAFRNFMIILPGILLALLVMLFLFDLFSPPVDWFFGVAFPITISLSVAMGIIIILWKIAHFKGFNILAVAFLILSLFCMACEIFIDKYTLGEISIHWSAIVAVSIFPISLVLFFVHYRMQKGKRLDSYFHV